MCCLPRRGPLQTSASSSAAISRYGRRWFSGLMPASLKTAAGLGARELATTAQRRGERLRATAQRPVVQPQLAGTGRRCRP